MVYPSQENPMPSRTLRIPLTESEEDYFEVPVSPTDIYPHFKRFPANAIPQHIYHYTSASGLYGILESGKILATNFTFLNDSKEGKVAIEFADPLLLEKQNSTQDQIESSLLTNVRKRILGEKAPEFHVASFSSRSDMLSQWRSYCPQGGYSLGIPLEHFQLLSSPPGWEYFGVVPCAYGELAQSDIGGVIDFYLNAFRRMRDKISDEERVRFSVKYWERRLLHHLQVESAVCKKAEFSAEDEWRLVLRATSNGKPRPVQFRTTGSLVIPHVSFDLGDLRSGVEPVKIVVGPSPFQDVAYDGARILCDQFLGANGELSRSTVSYRDLR